MIKLQKSSVSHVLEEITLITLDPEIRELLQCGCLVTWRWTCALSGECMSLLCTFYFLMVAVLLNIRGHCKTWVMRNFDISIIKFN